MTVSARDLEQVFASYIAALARGAELEIDGDTPISVLTHAAKVLGRFLSHDSAEVFKLVLLWRSSTASLGVEWTSDASVPLVLAREAIQMLDAVPPASTSGERTYEPLRIVWWGDDRATIRISRVSTDSASEGDTLEIRRISRTHGRDERWNWFSRYLTGLGELHREIRIPLRAHTRLLRSRLESQVQVLRDARGVTLRDRIRKSVEPLREIEALGASEILEEILIPLLLALFGTGRQVRSLGMITRRESNDTSTMLAGLIERVRSIARDLAPSNAARLLAVTDCFAAVTAPDVAPISEGSDELLALLAKWARIHELYRRAADHHRGWHTWAAQAEDAWNQAMEATVAVLRERLRDPADRRVAPMQSRNWLVLWFCVEMLAAPSSGTAEDAALRADVAYTLREALRRDLFGHRVDYFEDSRTVTPALGKLVVHHSTRVVGISTSHHLQSLLELVAGEGRANAYASLDHLQHICDIYIAGHFLLSARICRGDAGDEHVSAGEMFANGATPDVVLGYRQAFTLAALFHDIGHVVLPPDSRRTDQLPELDSHVTEVLELRGEETVRLVAKQLTETFVKQLGLDDEPETGAHRPAYFQHDLAARLQKGFLLEAGDCRVNHGLIGAWYLHRVCLRAVELQRPIGPEYQRMAIRAVLLHDAIREEVDPEVDPIAALLIACNEVFAWNPAHDRNRNSRRTAASAAAPAGYQMERSIEIPRLSFADGPNGGWQINSRRHPSGTWPDIIVELRPPEELNTSVLHILLTKAQAMRRIKPSARTGFSPRVLLRFASDPEYLQAGFDTRTALLDTLGQAGERPHPELIEWCHETEPNHLRFRKRPDGVDTTWDEEVRLGHRTHRLHDRDVDELFPDLDAHVRSYVRNVRLEDELD